MSGVLFYKCEWDILEKCVRRPKNNYFQPCSICKKNHGQHIFDDIKIKTYFNARSDRETWRNRTKFGHFSGAPLRGGGNLGTFPEPPPPQRGHLGTFLEPPSTGGTNQLGCP